MAEQSTYEKINAAIPADATGAFVGIQAALNQTQSKLPVFVAWANFATIIIIAALMPFYLARVADVRDHNRIAFLIFTFFIWGLSITERINYVNALESINIGDMTDYIMSSVRLVVILWTFLIVPAFSIVLQKTEPG